MRVQGQPFRLRILGHDGKPVNETDAGYAHMAHEEPYQIEMKNEHDSRRAGATVSVDGKPFPQPFALNPGEVLALETKPGTGQRLTAIVDNTVAGDAAGLDQVGDSHLGLIKVEFVLEGDEPPAPPKLITQEIRFEPGNISDILGGFTFDRGTTFGGGFSDAFGGDMMKGGLGLGSFGGGSIPTRSTPTRSDFGSSATRSRSTPPAATPKSAPPSTAAPEVPEDKAMGTGLTGASAQTFGTTSFHRDPAFTPVTLSVRFKHSAKRTQAYQAEIAARTSTEAQPLRRTRSGSRGPGGKR